MPTCLPYVDSLPHGIHVIDTGFQRPGFDAAYLIVEDGAAAYVDTGTNYSVPRLLAALAAVGLEPEAVAYVIVTHVHLDHAGGAGLLMQSLPSAQLVVHPRGARHMIDPTQLFNSARAVYGDAEMSRLYGVLVAIPPERVLATEDGMTLRLADRALLFVHTPGHARHHHCIWDERSQGFFTGDTFGLSYREFDVAGRPWVLPTSTPVQFEPEPLKASVRRMLDFAPENLYLTHYGRVGDAARLGALMQQQIDAMAALALELANQPQRHAALKDALSRLYLSGIRAHGCALSDEQIQELLATDIELNAQGLQIWVDRLDRAAQHKSA